MQTIEMLAPVFDSLAKFFALIATLITLYILVRKERKSANEPENNEIGDQAERKKRPDEK